MLALAGFLCSLVIHLSALWGRTPTSEGWLIVPFLGAFLSWIAAAYLSGAKAGRMAAIPFSEVVKDCPTWLKRTDYFFSAYAVLIVLGCALRSSGGFHWKQVELPVSAGFLFVSALCMMFYTGSFCMLFGKLFGTTRRANS
jgi:hypothetical protein